MSTRPSRNSAHSVPLRPSPSDRCMTSWVTVTMVGQRLVGDLVLGYAEEDHERAAGLVPAEVGAQPRRNATPAGGQNGSHRWKEILTPLIENDGVASVPKCSYRGSMTSTDD